MMKRSKATRRSPKPEESFGDFIAERINYYYLDGNARESLNDFFTKSLADYLHAPVPECRGLASRVINCITDYVDARGLHSPAKHG